VSQRLRTLLLSVLACALALAAGTACAQPLEYAVKAAFLTKFPAFVSWPAGAMRPGDPLRICVVGDNPFGGALELSARGRSVDDHPLEIRQLPLVDRGSGCQVIYAAGSARQSATEALQAVRGEPVLTVTDAAEGSARGMIHFVLFGERVRFHIDTAQAVQGGLAMNSKLLALALSVKR
jgi:hypothetical protein